MSSSHCFQRERRNTGVSLSPLHDMMIKSFLLFLKDESYLQYLLSSLSNMVDWLCYNLGLFVRLPVWLRQIVTLDCSCFQTLATSGCAEGWGVAVGERCTEKRNPFCWGEQARVRWRTGLQFGSDSESHLFRVRGMEANTLSKGEQEHVGGVRRISLH